MPHIRTAAALLGDFDPAFPDERGLGPDDDRVPGRDLAELVAAGHRRAQDFTAAASGRALAAVYARALGLP